MNLKLADYVTRTSHLYQEIVVEKGQDISHQMKFIQSHFYQNLHNSALQAALKGMDDISASRVSVQKKLKGRLSKL